MDDQAKFNAQAGGSYFGGTKTGLAPIEGTVARGELQAENDFYRGKDENGKFVKAVPFKVDLDLVKLGKAKYDIYWSVCHGFDGVGNGIVIQRGYRIPPPNLHDQRIKNFEDGYVFDVISNGVRNMASYKHLLKPKERWAVVSYLRALQKSQNANLNQVPEKYKEQIK